MCSRISKKLYKYLAIFKWPALVWMVIAPFYTKPRWCLEKFLPDDPNYEFCGFNVDFAKDENFGNEDFGGDY